MIAVERILGLTAEVKVKRWDTFAVIVKVLGDKAWAYIGVDGKKLQADKAKFLNTVVPKWVQSAKQKGKLIEL